MEQGTSLDDILNSEPVEQVETQPQEAPAQPRDEQGRFASGEQAETPQEGPPPSEQEPSHIPFAALKDERAKRQQMEEQFRQSADRLSQYEAYFAQMQQGQQPQQEQDPLALVAQQVAQMLQPQTEMQLLTMRVNIAEEQARAKWADYDERVETFKEAAKANPFLLQELKAAANPAEYAYNAASRMIEAKQYGSPAPSREQMEAEIRQKIMAEIGMTQKPQAPVSMAQEQSRGARSGPAWSGPTPLGDILR